MSTLGFASVEPATDACFTTTNAKYGSTGAPARMADGRLMTDYRPRCFQYPVSAMGHWGVEGARQRMIHGADELMGIAREVNNRKVTPTECVDTMVPELYKRVCTWNGCKTIPGNFQGVGVGRIYVPSAAAMATNPQALSDSTMPAVPMTYPRAPPRIASKCALNDPETAWSVKGPAAAYGGSAKSHPYSAPRA